MATKRSAAGGRGRRTARKKGAKSSGAQPQVGAKKARGQAKGGKLYTLTEVGKMASVSMPTLQKYKKLFADRIPSVGEGRKQRYPREAVAVLRQLKKENLARRGRPPKSGGQPRKAASKRSPKAGTQAEGLLTLTEISRRTKISYPTVSRYVKLFLDRIPHVGKGRQRRFPPEAVPVFLQLREESRPGRPAGAPKAAKASRRPAGDASLAARLRKLEMGQIEIGRQLSALAKQLKKPLQVTIKR